MLNQSACIVVEILQSPLLALSVADFSFELFWDDMSENIKRALQNLYDLSKTGQRRLGLCVALYIVFVIIVIKVISPKKKILR